MKLKKIVGYINHKRLVLTIQCTYLWFSYIVLSLVFLNFSFGLDKDVRIDVLEKLQAQSFAYSTVKANQKASRIKVPNRNYTKKL